MLKVVCQALISSIYVIWCIKADCDSPPNISNSKNNITGSKPYLEGTVARYDCNIGYNTAGTSRYYTCTSSGWTGGNLQCELIYCSHVEPPENGRVINTPTNEVGSSINFACNEGHDMSGSDNMLCRTDGNWLPAAPPICNAKDCGEFGSIQYATLFQDNSETERNHYGSVVEVTCSSGRVLNGPPRVTCEATGQWGARPVCKLLECPPYPNINATCLSNSQLLGDFYFILCKEEISTRTGPDAAECIDGAWDSLEMACLCDCKIPEYNLSISNLNKYGNLPHSTTLQWTCKNGSAVSPVDVTCTDGILKVVIDGKEIPDTNYANITDINRTIMSMLCILPTTVSPTTTTMAPVRTTLTSSSETTESVMEDATTTCEISNGTSAPTANDKTETTTVEMKSSSETTESIKEDATTTCEISNGTSTPTANDKTETTTVEMKSSAIRLASAAWIGLMCACYLLDVFT